MIFSNQSVSCENSESRKSAILAHSLERRLRLKCGGLLGKSFLGRGEE
jgi:hypothetical protein